MAFAADKYIGMTLVMNNGLKATVMNYVSYTDITVRFEDGYIVEHTYMSCFKKGNIKHPGVDVFLIKQRHKWLGVSKMMNCGLVATIIEYNSTFDITVRFEDGVQKKSTIDLFNKGRILHPACNMQQARINKSKNKWLGKSKMMKCGLKATISEFIDVHNITVTFEDGQQAHGSTYGFEHGSIKHPSMIIGTYGARHDEAISKHIGQTKVMNCGLAATITEYRSTYDIDVQFEDGEYRTNTSRKAFEAGSIGHPILRHGITKDFKGLHTKFITRDVEGTPYYVCKCKYCGKEDIWSAKEMLSHIALHSNSKKDKLCHI